jgi:glyoxylase-like metal-dependent hydrolase (beta-lactamase superfamily II)
MLQTTRYDEVTRFDLARTLLGKGRYWTTCYLLDGLLIDTGCAHAAPELLRALAGRSVQRVINTHTHEDHIGADGPLQRRDPGLAIQAHPLALPVLADPRRAQPLHPYRRLFWGWPQPARAEALADGEIVRTPHYALRVVYTPGHSRDHLCLYEERQGWLFTGDLFVGGRDRALRAGSDIWQIIASLQRVAALPARVLFPGSARVRHEPQRELQAKIDYLQSLGEAVLALHRQGKDPAAIRRALLGGPMWVERVTLGHFSRLHLVRSYLGLEAMDGP